MIFYIIFIVCMLVGIGIVFFGQIDPDIGNLLVEIGIIGLFICMIFSFFTTTNPEALYASKSVYRDGLIYQYENDLYKNDAEKAELLNKIIDFNAAVISGREHKKNIFFNMFTSSVWFELELIPYQLKDFELKNLYEINMKKNK